MGGGGSRGGKGNPRETPNRTPACAGAAAAIPSPIIATPRRILVFISTRFDEPIHGGLQVDCFVICG
jgi:hypothetical protein